MVYAYMKIEQMVFKLVQGGGQYGYTPLPTPSLRHRVVAYFVVIIEEN